MVTKEEMLHFESNKEIQAKTSYQVTGSELSQFIDNELELAELIADKKKQYEKEKQISSTQAYFDIEEMCQISADTLKKAICHSRKTTRSFLYKFVVGFQMTLDEANEYFELCGGPLTRKKAEDYICMNALRDKDSVQQLVDDFEKHLGLKIGFSYNK